MLFVVRLYIGVDIVVMSGDVFCCSEVCGILVGISVFNIMFSELLIISEINYICDHQCVSARVMSVSTAFTTVILPPLQKNSVPTTPAVCGGSVSSVKNWSTPISSIGLGV